MIELVVATSVVMLVLVAVVAGVAVAVRNTRFSKEKALSVRYTQESIEWLRSRRDLLGWNAFYGAINNDSSGGKAVYCVNSLPSQLEEFEGMSSVGEGEGCGLGLGENSEFRRYLELTPSGGEQIQVESVVKWDAGQGDETETRLKTSLRRWR